MSSALKGRRGEDRAAAFLQGRGYRILARNVRGPRGEIDLVAGREGRVAFCEVKTWDGLPEESLEWSIDWRKRRRIVHTAKYYLRRNPQYLDWRVGFDVILISKSLSHLKHFENAFGESDD